MSNEAQRNYIRRAHQCALQFSERSASMKWHSNRPWIEAATESWQRTCNGEPVPTLAMPQPDGDKTEQDLLNEGIVGVYW